MKLYHKNNLVSPSFWPQFLIFNKILVNRPTDQKHGGLCTSIFLKNYGQKPGETKLFLYGKVSHDPNSQFPKVSRKREKSNSNVLNFLLVDVY